MKDQLQSNKDLKAALAAQLEAEGISRSRIASELGVSEAYVARLIKTANDRGWIVRAAVFQYDQFSGEDIRRMELKRFGFALSELLQRLQATGECPGVLRGVQVCRTDIKATHGPRFETRLTQFGVPAAIHVQDLLASTRPQKIGVTWGKTVSSVTTHIHLGDKRKEIWWIPLCGDPFDGTDSELRRESSASAIAGHLRDTVSHGKGPRLSLAGIPSFIPEEFDHQQRATIFEFLLHSPSYKTIFGDHAGDRNGLVDQLDMVITSVGVSDRPFGPLNEEICRLGSINRDDLQDLVLGDISGLLVCRPEKRSNERAQKRVQEWNKRWTGVSQHSLYQCARKKNSAGVVVVAVGANKASMVKEAVTLGLASHLIIDEELAIELRNIA